MFYYFNLTESIENSSALEIFLTLKLVIKLVSITHTPWS